MVAEGPFTLGAWITQRQGAPRKSLATPYSGLTNRVVMRSSLLTTCRHVRDTLECALTCLRVYFGLTEAACNSAMFSAVFSCFIELADSPWWKSSLILTNGRATKEANATYSNLNHERLRKTPIRTQLPREDCGCFNLRRRNKLLTEAIMTYRHSPRVEI